jgi:hypothetical protein
MTHSPQHQAEILQDRYGLKVAARLSAGSQELPHDLSERLRVARLQAVTRRKVVRVAQTRLASNASVAGNTATMSFGDEGWNLWSRLASALPLVTLVVGLVAINVIQNEDRANEVAEVDAALLTDDLPPAAYTDSGFVQFLKSAGNHTASE